MLTGLMIAGALVLLAIVASGFVAPRADGRILWQELWFLALFALACAVNVLVALMRPSGLQPSDQSTKSASPPAEAELKSEPARYHHPHGRFIPPEAD
jgi:hypothetical protein